MRQERLDFRREQQLASYHGVEERTNAYPVARQEQGAALRVPDAQCPLAIKPAHRLWSLFLIEMKDHLGVGFRAKPVAFSNQVLAQLEVVENLSVEGDPERAVFVRQRLVSAGYIEDAETCVSKAGAVFDIHPAVIRAAMVDHGGHGGEPPRLDPMAAARHSSRDAAHVRFRSEQRTCHKMAVILRK